MQIKITIRYHLTSVRMTIVKKINKQSMLEWIRKKGSPSHYWEYKWIQPLWRTLWGFLKKLEIKLSYDPSNSLIGIYPESTIIQKVTRIP